MKDRFDLDRFVKAQNADGIYDRAITELRNGRKTSHWIWFVFPQIAGLGSSPMSSFFAISSLDEARAYLEHPVLGPRLLEAAGIVADTKGSSAEGIFGRVDAQKLNSSMTLFLRASPTEAVFSKVLGLFYDGLPDSATDDILRG